MNAETMKSWQAWATVSGVAILCMVAVDMPLSDYAAARLDGSWTQFWRRLTRFGDWHEWWLATGGTAIVCGVIGRVIGDSEAQVRWRLRARKAAFILLTLIAAGLTVTLLKWVFGRPRPFPISELPYYQLQPFHLPFDNRLMSMPSGHAQVGWSVAAPLILLYPRLRVPAAIFGTTIAATRVALNLHYVSDVIVGSFVGIVVAAVLYGPYFNRFGAITPTSGQDTPAAD